MIEDFANKGPNYLGTQTPSETLSTTSEDQSIREHINKLFPKIQELCFIFRYRKTPPLTFGAHISFKISPENDTLSKCPYFMIVLPPLQSYLSIKPSDLFIYSSDQRGVFPKSLHTHKLIYDSCPHINFIIHSHDSNIDAVSSLKCGLLKLSNESTMLRNIAYYDHSIFVPKSDENDSHIPNELSSKINDSRILFLKCNGALCYGSTLDEAIHYMLHLEAASKIQILAGCRSDPIYCNEITDDFLNDQILTNEFFHHQYTNLLRDSQNYNDLLNRRHFLFCARCDKYNDNSSLNNTSLDEIPNLSFKSNNLVMSYMDDHNAPKRISSSHEPKVNIPKCESTRENTLSYEFRSNITSTASINEKSNDAPEEMSGIRRAKRFKAKRCCSLTSGVEKAIAKKVFGSTTPYDDRQT